MATIQDDRKRQASSDDQQNGWRPPQDSDSDPAETSDWLDSLQYVLESQGPERAAYLLSALQKQAQYQGVNVPPATTTPYCNTIKPDQQPDYPGDRNLERRIKSLVRWNAMAMVVKANADKDAGIGGHISTFASSATLYEVAQNHFFKGPDGDGSGDQVYFQGHASPGMYARAYLEGRISAEQLHNFRRELQPGGGLSSYPHPWLMPNFWQFPTVSMGLGPILSLYQARFNRYLEHRGLVDTSNSRVWAFLGDGECDEPETLGALTMGAREKLDNLTWIINCNLQRLDGPVRGNGKIIQELEGLFRGAGWNVIKVVWGSGWDALLKKDTSGMLLQRMMESVDGEFQKYSVTSGDYVREKFFGKYPELLELVNDMSDDEIQELRRGGHDPLKVYAAYHAATHHKGQPTVILAKTIKGYGLGEAGEGRNIAHNSKKLNEDELRAFRKRFEIPIDEEQVTRAPFYRPDEDSPEMKYLLERRKELGGYVPSRNRKSEVLETPDLDSIKKFLQGSGDNKASTTMAFGQMLGKLLKDKQIGKRIVPIIPDEARTFGMEGLFGQCGIYASTGQLYEPVDRQNLMYYKEAKDGQILQEGINEAGGMSSFIAAGSSYATHKFPMIPFFIYYSMFGFQRVGDLIWLAGDMRVRGFLMGGTSGRTTLNGEGLQHEDGHSHLIAMSVPNIEAYDPAYAYEIGVILIDGMKRMYHDNEDIFYYITIHNENYVQPPMPEGDHVADGILKGLYKYKTVDAGSDAPMVQIFGSGAIMRMAVEAQEVLAEKYGVSSNVWGATSYKALHRDAIACQRWNLLHPTETPKKSYLEEILEGEEGPFISASDNVRAVAQTVDPWVPGGLYVLGTDGFGRSETREALRRFFEVDVESIVIAALSQLAEQGKFKPEDVKKAIEDLGVDPEKANPMTV
ncbi:Pyruvate dehydrogenase (Acetyl-transferring), homodimeric type [Planctomycetales bacterium 10988]|nr:Pyruvate dehydrogenase (Acetyl-transferring), homodimeric type [Planctomycetales bacterium 10988]